MKHPLALLSALMVATVALAGCGSGSNSDEAASMPTPTASTSSIASAPPNNPPAGSTARKDISPSGMGPYAVGVLLSNLESDGLVSQVKATEGCPEYTVAQGTAEHREPILVFHQGALINLRVDTPLARTTEGARVAMKSSAIKAKHPDGTELSDGAGGKAWFVTEGDNALLFRLTRADTVAVIEAGQAEALRLRYVEGKDC